jgi:hypothetical protein
MWIRWLGSGSNGAASPRDDPGPLVACGCAIQHDVPQSAQSGQGRERPGYEALAFRARWGPLLARVARWPTARAYTSMRVRMDF